MTDWLYDHQFLTSTLQVLNDNIDDLSMWSAHNDDQFNEEIDLIKKTLELIGKQVLDIDVMALAKANIESTVD